MADTIKIILQAEDQFSPTIEQARRTTAKFKTEADGTAASLKDIGDASKIVSPRLGELASRFREASAGLVKLGAVAGVAGAAGAVAAYGAAAVKVAGQVRDMTRAAHEQAQELQALGLLTSQQRQRVDEATASLDAMDAATGALNASIAAGLSPTVKEVSTDLTAMALAMADAAKFSGPLIEFVATGVVELSGFGRALDLVATATSGYRPEAEALTAQLKEQAEAAADAATALDDIAAAEIKVRKLTGELAALQAEGIDAVEERRKADQRALDTEEGAIREKMDGLERYSDAWEALQVKLDGIAIERQIVDTKAEQEKTKIAEAESAKRIKIAEAEAEALAANTAKALDDAVEQQLKMTERIREDRQAAQEERLAFEQAFQDAQEQTFDLQSEMQKDATKQQAQANQKRTDFEETYQQSTQQMAAETAGVIAGLITQQFGDSQAAALVNVAIQTAVGISKAFAQNPPPSPLGYAGAAQVAAVGATQAAIIAAKSLSTGSKQKRHIGGVVTDEGSPPPGASPDERLVLAQVGERIVDRRAAGGATAGASVNVIEMGGRWYDAATGRQLRKSGSALNRATRARRGQRRFKVGNG